MIFNCCDLFEAGDFVLQAPRRTFTHAASAAGVKVFAYLFTDRDGTIIPELITSPPAPGSLGGAYICDLLLISTNQLLFFPLPVPHTSEIYYVFNILANRTPNAVGLSSIMQDYWISFAVSLNPNDNHGNVSRM